MRKSKGEHGGGLGVAGAMGSAVGVGLLGTPSVRRRFPLLAPILTGVFGLAGGIAAIWGGGATRDTGLGTFGAAAANATTLVDEAIEGLTAQAGAEAETGLETPDDDG